MTEHSDGNVIRPRWEDVARARAVREISQLSPEERADVIASGAHTPELELLVAPSAVPFVDQATKDIMALGLELSRFGTRAESIRALLLDLVVRVERASRDD